MIFNVENLQKYDLENAKVGDNVIVVREGRDVEGIVINKIKSISAKRKVIALENGYRYNCNGRTIGEGTYLRGHNTFLLCNEENIRYVKKYMSYRKMLDTTLIMIDKASRCEGRESIMNLSEDKLENLYNVLIEVLGTGE